MILRIEDLRVPCATILNAVDSNDFSQVTETLELQVVEKVLYMSVTNREYFVTVKINIGEEIDFHATVNATLFLKLVSQITTDTVEFIVDGSSLVIKGNGKYKLPLIFENDSLLKLPEINLENITVDMDIDGSVLLSILNNNGKQLGLGIISNPVQKFYYVDSDGAITFTSGACVNSFKLTQPVKMLLNQRLVKLFKLFKSGTVRFNMAQDPISDEIIQTKICFTTANIEISAILSCDDTMLNSVPVSAIRGRANTVHKYTTVLNKAELMETLNRLALFSGKEVGAAVEMTFGHDSVELSDERKENKETIYYKNNSASIDSPYTAMLDITEFKAVIDTVSEEYVTLCFGDNQAFLLRNNNIVNVIPEVHLV